MNTNDRSKTIRFKDYTEQSAGFKIATDVLSGSVLNIEQEATIPAMKMWVLELH